MKIKYLWNINRHEDEVIMHCAKDVWGIGIWPRYLARSFVLFIPEHEA
jgi:hypothetical protein